MPSIHYYATLIVCWLLLTYTNSVAMEAAVKEDLFAQTRTPATLYNQTFSSITTLLIEKEFDYALKILPTLTRAMQEEIKEMLIKRYRFSILEYFASLPLTQLAGHTETITALCFSPTDHYALTGSESGELFLWDFDSDPLRAIPLEGHTCKIWELLFSRDGKRALSGAFNGELLLWNLEKKPLRSESNMPDPSAMPEKIIPVRLEGHIMGIEALAFAPDGNSALSCSFDKQLLFWDLSQSKPQAHRLQILSDDTVILAFHPEKMLGVSAAGVTVIFWDLTDYAKITSISMRADHATILWNAFFSDDGKFLITLSMHGDLTLWRLDKNSQVTPTKLERIDTINCTELALSKSGKNILVGTTLADCFWCVLDNGPKVRIVPLPRRGGTAAILKVAFADQHTALAGTRENQIIIYHTSPNKIRIIDLFTHPMEVKHINFSNNADYTLSSEKNHLWLRDLNPLKAYDLLEIILIVKWLVLKDPSVQQNARVLKLLESLPHLYSILMGDYWSI